MACEAEQVRADALENEYREAQEDCHDGIRGQCGRALFLLGRSIEAREALWRCRAAHLLPSRSAFEGVEPMQIEETIEGDQLVVKAELPGIDPDRDVEISVQDHILHIRAERRQETKEETKGHHRSEFRYGSFARRIPLPEGVFEEQVTASYKDGILEVRVPVPAQKPAEAAKKIQVRRT